MSDFLSQVESAEDGTANGPKKPFWALDMANEEELLAWLNAEIAYLKDQAADRHLNQRKNLAAYRGIQLSAGDRQTRDEAATDNAPNRRSKNPRVVYNHMVDMVEQDVARMTEYRGAVAAKPFSDENSERVTARISEKLIEAFWAKVDIDELMSNHSRRKRIFGEDFVWVTWNENLGPYSKEWIKAAFERAGIKEDPTKLRRGQIYDILRKKVKETPKIPLVDPDTGAEVKDADGKPMYIDRPIRQGDVEYRLWFSDDMFLQRKDTYDEVEYGFGRERVKVETLKAKHPKKRDKIKADSGDIAYDADTCEDAARADEAEVFHFYHRSTDELDSGRYIKFTRTAILRNRANPYLGDDYRAIFPWERTVDIPTPKVLNGDATVTHGRGPQTVHNNLISLRVRNRFLFSHPKWFAPKGSVKIESLGNGTSVAWYKGGVPPQLSQPAINEANEAAMMQESEGALQKIMGVYGQSRGTPPAGITAAVALTFLDEQESKRANPGIAAHTRTLRSIAKRTSWLMADNYEDDDGRLEQILGPNMAASAPDFKMADLRSLGSIDIQNTAALPHQKSARLQHIIDLRKEFPGIVPDDMAVDLLGLGEVEKLRNIVTVAIRKAESENDRMMNGVDVPAPLEFEYHLQHYRVHMRQMNELSFLKLPEKSRKHFEEHMGGHEYVMHELGLKNPQFAMVILQEFPGFPYFYEPETMGLPELPPPAQAMPPGAGAVPPQTALPPEGMPPGAEAMTLQEPGFAPGSEMLSPEGAPSA